jgi:hypothetical protein
MYILCKKELFLETTTTIYLTFEVAVVWSDNRIDIFLSALQTHLNESSCRNLNQLDRDIVF